jgi:prepilin-type N-terminal cleavage/methylation domain-containing protein
MKSSQQSGFTLIELMISLVIGLIIVAAALVLFLRGKECCYTTRRIRFTG